MNPPRDNNNKDNWDIDRWDLLSTDGPGDFEEFEDEDDVEDPHLEVVEVLDEDTIETRSVWFNRGVRLVAVIALFFFGTVFALPPVINIVRAVALKPDTPDYFDQLSGAGYPLRFDREEVRYSIVIPENYPIQEIGALERPLINAMQSWSDALDGRIRFVPAPADGSDDILVHFVTELETAGYATLRPGPRYRPEIYAKINIDYPMPSQIMLETVLCHELGHAMGIWGHSNYDGDSMYPVVSRRMPSPRDILTMRKIYDMQ